MSSITKAEPTSEYEIKTVLREARQWVEASTAQVRGLSAEAAVPGEVILRRIDAALASPAVVPESVRRLSEAAAALIADLDRSLNGVRDQRVITATNASVKRLRSLITYGPLSERAAEGGETVASQPVAEALAEFQRRNGYHKPVIEELLTEFGELLLIRTSYR